MAGSLLYPGMNLELFHRASCPYCKKVRNYLAENDLSEFVTYSDVGEDSEKLEELEELTDDHQVPCLVVDGKPLLESDDIIAWFQEHESELGESAP